MENRVTKLVYDGPFLETGELPALELANVLIGMDDLIKKSNSLLNIDQANTDIKVRAFKKGSFGVEFLIIQTAIKDGLNLFNHPAIAGLTSLMTLLGLLEGKGLIGLIKNQIKGRAIKNIVKHNESVKVILENGESIELSSELYLLYSDKTVKESIEKIVMPLNIVGVENLSIFNGENNEVTIGKEEANYFKHVPYEEIINETLSEELLYLDNIGLSGGKWRVSSKDKKNFFVSIKDPAFIKEVNSREKVFAKGDQLLVILNTIFKNTSDGIKIDYEIIQVLKQFSGPSQYSLIDLKL